MPMSMKACSKYCSIARPKPKYPFLEISEQLEIWFHRVAEEKGDK